MNHRHAPTLVSLLCIGLLAFGCEVTGGSDHVSPCEETIMPMDNPFVADIERGGERSVLDFDGLQVQLSYSDRPGDDACVFDAQVVLSKGGPYGCTLTLETGPYLQSRDKLLIQRLALSANGACPSWGLTAPVSVESTVTEGWHEGYGTIEVPDLVDEDDSCYAGEVTIDLWGTEISLNGELVFLDSGPSTYFVDVETTPRSLPCAE